MTFSSILHFNLFLSILALFRYSSPLFFLVSPYSNIKMVEQSGWLTAQIN